MQNVNFILWYMISFFVSWLLQMLKFWDDFEMCDLRKKKSRGYLLDV